jgi:outer membrane biosynthesis protein TonB
LRLPLKVSYGILIRMFFAQMDRRHAMLATYSVARAFALSILLHLLAFVTLELGYQNHWWNTTILFSKKQARINAETARRLSEVRRKQQQTNQEPPLLFVEVDPSQATEEAPKDSKYYSALNSKAANPDTKLDKPVPKIDGRQDKVPQTMDRARPAPPTLQPEPQAKPEPLIAEKQPEPKPAPPAPEQKNGAPTKPGDLAYAKPAEKVQEPHDTVPSEMVEPPKAPPPRPRTLEAARRQKGGMAGEKMKQQGGAKRFSLQPSFDVRATPFGAYDAAIIAAIQKRWYDLLDQREFAGSYSGKVVLEFRLNSDGRVTDMKVNETDVTEILSLLCQRAVQDPAPFAPWPPDLRRLVGKEFREVRFTFYYN